MSLSDFFKPNLPVYGLEIKLKEPDWNKIWELHSNNDLDRLKMFYDIISELPYYIGEFGVYKDGTLAKMPIDRIEKKVAATIDINHSTNLGALRTGKNGVLANFENGSFMEYNKTKILSLNDVLIKIPLEMLASRD